MVCFGRRPGGKENHARTDLPGGCVEKRDGRGGGCRGPGGAFRAVRSTGSPAGRGAAGRGGTCRASRADGRHGRRGPGRAGRDGRAGRLAHVRPHLRGAALLAADAGQPGERRRPRPRLVQGLRHAPSGGVDTARGRRRDVRDPAVEHHLRPRCRDGRGAVVLRPRSPRRHGPPCLLRRDQPGARRLPRTRLCRDPRRTSHRPGRGDGDAGVGSRYGHRPHAQLHHHRRTAGRRRQGLHR